MKTLMRRALASRPRLRALLIICNNSRAGGAHGSIFRSHRRGNGIDTRPVHLFCFSNFTAHRTIAVLALGVPAVAPAPHPFLLDQIKYAPCAPLALELLQIIRSAPRRGRTPEAKAASLRAFSL